MQMRRLIDVRGPRELRADADECEAAGFILFADVLREEAAILEARHRRRARVARERREERAEAAGNNT